MDRDPVCGMELRPGQEEASFTFQGTTYHFCSQECCKKFQADPKRYLKETAETPAANA
jgi:Cu+-exporting ATPase